MFPPVVFEALHPGPDLHSGRSLTPHRGVRAEGVKLKKRITYRDSTWGFSTYRCLLSG